MIMLNPSSLLAFRWTYIRWMRLLTTTDPITRQKARIESAHPSKVMLRNHRYTTAASTHNCPILAAIKPILSCSIFQNNCRGSWVIHDPINIAENIIPNGNHRTRYGLLVYAGKRYASMRATVYTIVIVTTLVPTNAPYSFWREPFITLPASSNSLVIQSFLTAITYNPKSAKADQIAKYFNIVE